MVWWCKVNKKSLEKLAGYYQGVAISTSVIPNMYLESISRYIDESVEKGEHNNFTIDEYHKYIKYSEDLNTEHWQIKDGGIDFSSVKQLDASKYNLFFWIQFFNGYFMRITANPVMPTTEDNLFKKNVDKRLKLLAILTMREFTADIPNDRIISQFVMLMSDIARGVSNNESNKQELLYNNILKNQRMQKAKAKNADKRRTIFINWYKENRPVFNSDRDTIKAWVKKEFTRFKPYYNNFKDGIITEERFNDLVSGHFRNKLHLKFESYWKEYHSKDNNIYLRSLYECIKNI